MKEIIGWVLVSTMAAAWLLWLLWDILRHIRWYREDAAADEIRSIHQEYAAANLDYWGKRYGND